MNSIEQYKEQVLAALRDQRPLRIRGGGTKDWYGERVEGQLLDTRSHRGIVAYEPSELVITARAGTPLAEIEAVLAAQRQMLAFEPPHFGAGATLGGAIAAGLSGPRRACAGAVRDFVLGVQMMDGRGEVLRFGGQVMKNVAGYDVSRLMAGSLGTLGLLLEVSVKVLPRPLCELTLRLECSEAEAIARLNAWGGQPLPLSASSWHAGSLMLRLSGSEAAVAAARGVIGGELAHEAAAHWEALREQRHRFFAGDAALWRLALPSATAAIGAADQLIEWGGAQRWLRTDASTADAHMVRALAEQYGGHATLFSGGDVRTPVFHPLPAALARLHTRMKDAFDPAHLFNPGRMY